MKLERNLRYLLRFSHLYLRMEVPNPAHSLSFFSLPKHCGRALLPVNVLLHSCRLHLPIVNFSPYLSIILKTLQLKLKPRISSFFNMSYLTDSCIIFTLKMESVSKNTIFGLKMMMKSDLGKIFLKFLHALTMSFLLLNFNQKYKFSDKNNMVSAWRNFKNIFTRPLFTIIFRPKIAFWDTDSILRVKTMYESVK